MSAGTRKYLPSCSTTMFIATHPDERRINFSFVDCRFDDIKEEKGEKFLNCGSCPSAMPSVSPSSFPSQAPSVSCAACPTNQAKYVVNTNKMNWEQHNAFATAIGCVMASITSAEEQDAAVDALNVLQASTSYFVYFGAITNGSGQGSTWTWTDGSESFLGDGVGESSNPNPYRNWNSAQPNGTGNRGGLYAIPTAGFQLGDWDDVTGVGLWPALYKCCQEQPVATDFEYCPVVP